ncbi:hypothetical protein VP01_547g1, partial [Puccinia sorghi]
HLFLCFFVCTCALFWGFHVPGPVKSTCNHLDFYPEFNKGLNVYKLSQSQKWIQDLSPAHQPPTCYVNGKHFYIFEPVQLITSDVVIPIFFYMFKSELTAKCLKINPSNLFFRVSDHIKITIPAKLHFHDKQLTSIPVTNFDLDYSKTQMSNQVLWTEACDGSFYESDGTQEQVIPLPNPKRIKVNGRIKRHKFNKHIAFYVTLAGLRPKISNQEFNCHFLSTSNIAGVLEMSKQVVDEINLMATDGFTAYDITLNQEVLIYLVVLCFLDNSPIHAEVTNTPKPGAALNPCGMFKFSVKKNTFKKSAAYVRKLYDIAMGINITRFKTKQKVFGVIDSINTKFKTEDRTNPAMKTKMELLDRNSPASLYNPFLNLEGFDGVQDTRVEVLHVVLLGIVKYLARDGISKLKAPENLTLIGRLQSFNSTSLNIASMMPQYLIQHIKSLVGRHFNIILQAAPFILLEFLSPKRKQIWLALCNLAPLIFQAKIENMDAHLKNLKLHIKQLLFHLINSSAHWVQKLKLHMLLHLPDSIQRFGPASLFPTEKFESYNGILRQASIHSNKQAPGRDIAITFANYSNLKYLLSNGMIYDQKNHRWESPASKVSQIFNDHPIQSSMGYNSAHSSNLHCLSYPVNLALKIPIDKLKPIPEALNFLTTHENYQQVLKLKLNEKEVLHEVVFIVIARNDTKLVASVDSIWQGTSSTQLYSEISNLSYPAITADHLKHFSKSVYKCRLCHQKS